jgi:hypothetical protein
MAATPYEPPSLIEHFKTAPPDVLYHYSGQEERWSHILRQPAKVDSPMQRTDHHEDAETVFG